MLKTIKVKSNASFEQLVGYVILLLILASLVYGISDSSIMRGVDEATAAKIALDYCKYNYDMDVMVEEPQHAKAELMTCSDVQEKTLMSECDDRKADAKMWFVITDGLWLLYGPAPINGMESSPIQVDACYVLIDETNGRRLGIRWSE